MMTREQITSLLAIDCGSIHTTVNLIDLADGVYSLTASAQTFSTYGPPWNDSSVGVIDALRHLEQSTERQFLTTTGTPIIPPVDDYRGVDACVVVISAAGPLSVILAALTYGLGLEAAHRAAFTTCAAVQYQFALDNIHTAGDLNRHIAAIQQTPADLLLLVGGVDGGTETPILNLAEIIALALNPLPLNTQPRIIYAGNTNLRSTLADIFRGLADFKPVANILPTLYGEDLRGVQAELDLLYTQYKLNTLPGVKTLIGWSANRPVTTARSFAHAIHYMGQSYNINVLGINIGGATTTLAACRPSVQHAIIRADIGMGHSLKLLLKQLNLPAICCWLPFEISPETLQNILYTRAIYPRSVPSTYQEVLIETAVIREALRLMVAQAHPVWQRNSGKQSTWFNWQLIIGAGMSLVGISYPALAALVLLDGLEPAGICSLALNRHGLLDMLGGIAMIQPLAAAHLAANDALLKLGTAIITCGTGRAGETALKLKITYPDGTVTEEKIPGGVLQKFPLQTGQQAALELHPGKTLSLYADGSSPGKAMAAVVEGGVVGIIVDTRGRPIALPLSPEDRRRQQQAWLTQLELPSGTKDDLHES